MLALSHFCHGVGYGSFWGPLAVVVVVVIAVAIPLYTCSATLFDADTIIELRTGTTTTTAIHQSTLVLLTLV
jgi:hypothetical protein